MRTILSSFCKVSKTLVPPPDITYYKRELWLNFPQNCRRKIVRKNNEQKSVKKKDNRT